MEEALKKAYRAGFVASGEGYNGEYPFRDYGQSPETDKDWVAQRDKEVLEILAEQPAPVQGWKLVPVDPTIQMCLAGAKAADSNDGAAENAYHAMLAATPQPAPVHPDSVRIDWLTNNPVDALDIFGRVKGADAVRWIRQEIDNAIKENT